MSESNEAIVYQIGHPDATSYRFIVVAYGHDDEAVQRQLQAGEFIDTTGTLNGLLGGHVTVIR